MGSGYEDEFGKDVLILNVKLFLCELVLFLDCFFAIFRVVEILIGIYLQLFFLFLVFWNYLILLLLDQGFSFVFERLFGFMDRYQFTHCSLLLSQLFLPLLF